MQVQQSFERPQLPLFDAFLAGASSEPLIADGIAHSEDDQAFSELALRGAAGHCLHLLAPILRELSQNLIGVEASEAGLFKRTFNRLFGG